MSLTFIEYASKCVIGNKDFVDTLKSDRPDLYELFPSERDKAAEFGSHRDATQLITWLSLIKDSWDSSESE
jgi:hypothetical protein